METFSEKPEILKVGFDEAALDAYWISAERDKSIKKLTSTLEAKRF